MPNRAPRLEWDLPAAGRATPSLSRARIVAAAIAVADAEGLEAVSIRRVASELATQPMSLYSHVAAKDDLVALMLNDVSRQFLVPEPLPDDWREALRRFARRAFDVYLTHPWTLNALGRGTRIVPNHIRRAEQLASVVQRLALAPEDGWAVASIVPEWVTGHALHVLKLREDAELADGLYAADATTFPALAAVLRTRRRRDQDRALDEALEIVLDGIDRRITDATPARLRR